jgi:hypothetical protein
MGRENAVQMRQFLIWPLLFASAWAKRPPIVPAHHFCFSVPAHFASPAPQQWVSPDGGISVTWSELARTDSLDDWLAQCRKKFPGKLLQEPTPLTMGGQPAWLLVGEHQGRLQRLYITLRQGHGALVVWSFVPTQSFAASTMLADTVSTFRWLEDL